MHTFSNTSTVRYEAASVDLHECIIRLPLFPSTTVSPQRRRNKVSLVFPGPRTTGNWIPIAACLDHTYRGTTLCFVLSPA